MSRSTVVALIVVVGVIFVISGLRYEQGVIYAISPPICGPLTDANGNPAGDAGPCPSIGPLPTPVEPGWRWAPFWAPGD